MAGLVPAIHGYAFVEDVDARDKPGHDVHMLLAVSGEAARASEIPAIGRPQYPSVADPPHYMRRGGSL
jgi:hypothetical protein